MTFLKRSLSLKGHRTSLALEPDFWTELDRIAEDRSLSLAALVGMIDAERAPDQPLSSAARVFVLRTLKAVPENG